MNDEVLGLAIRLVALFILRLECLGGEGERM